MSQKFPQDKPLTKERWQIDCSFVRKTKHPGCRQLQRRNLLCYRSKY